MMFIGICGQIYSLYLSFHSVIQGQFPALLEGKKIFPPPKFSHPWVPMIKQFPPARLPKIIFPLNVSPPWLLKLSSCPPCLADDTKIIPPDPRGGGRTLWFPKNDQTSGDTFFIKFGLFHLMCAIAPSHVSTCAASLMHVKYSMCHSCL